MESTAGFVKSNSDKSPPGDVTQGLSGIMGNEVFKKNRAEPEVSPFLFNALLLISSTYVTHNATQPLSDITGDNSSDAASSGATKGFILL